MLAIIISLKLWGQYFRGKRIVIFCDNNSVCQVISTGKSRSEPLQDCLREICYLAAYYQFEIKHSIFLRKKTDFQTIFQDGIWMTGIK